MAAPDPYLTALGVAIRRRREHLGLSQDALALEIGTSQRRIYEWERGMRDLRMAGSMVAIAAALRMSPVALMAATEVELTDAAAGTPQRSTT